MEKLDLKDRKILYELDLNCRQSNTQIGKKVGLKKDVVSYRIKRMEEAGIIAGYWTEINTFNLGYDVYRVYINFQDVNADIKNEITDYFAQYKNAWAVISVKGPIDLDVMIWVNDSQKFHQYWNNSLDKYGKYFSNNTISVLTGGIGFKKSYLLPETEQDPNREYFVLKKCGKTVEIDEIDYQILDELSIHARIPLIDLAAKLN
jgi:DNA-binding Lrp family transcriptional regulator